jgi:hypothetical protein
VITPVSALNLLWAVSCLIAGVCLYRRSAALADRRLRRFTAIALAAVCLFPVVSSSDDLVRLEFLNTSMETRTGAGVPSQSDPDSNSNQTQLARVFDALDAVDMTASFDFAETFVAS